MAIYNNKKKDRIPLLTYYSPSHEELYNKFFYPSYLKYLSRDFELIVLQGEQLCKSIFRQGNWNKQVKEKIIFVEKFIQSSSCDYLLFSDVDIIFFKNIITELIEEIGNYDLAIQNDSTNENPHTFCSGFYFCRINGNTRSFFKNLVENFDDELDDQQNLNLHLLQNESFRYKALSKRFYNFSHSPINFWSSGCKIPFPEFPIVMYHANFTMGLANKDFLLNNFLQRHGI